MTTEQLDHLKKGLLDLIKEDGTPTGNKKLRTEFLNKFKSQVQSDSDYWEVRNALIDEGKIAKGGGKGGSVRRIVIEATTEVPQIDERPIEKKPRKKDEQDLYEPFYQTISKFWVQDYNIKPLTFVIEKTANQGSKDTGGKWTRPDITLVEVQTFPFVPGRNLEVTTFEVKPNSNYKIDSVFETASHSVFAHKSYLAIHIPKDKDFEYAEKIEKLCKRFGIGLITFEDPSDYDTFDVKLEADTQNPSFFDVNQFLTQQVKINKDRLRELVKY